MNSDKRHPSDYLNDLEEWQDHQYDPGYWTGGNIPPYLKYPRRPLGIILVVMGGFSLLGMAMGVIADFSFANAFGSSIGLLVGLLFLAAGIKIIRARR
ncbi:MAG: hypothetical protein ABRQ24_08375 [Syntrophomonadaceae bacterium]